MIEKNNCNWEKIDSFRSLIEFNRFKNWLQQQIDADMVKQVTVNNYYLSCYTEEYWYKCLSSGEVWRLVGNDGPFQGCWVPVE